MANFMMFANAFENNESKYEGFKSLCFDVAKGIQVAYTAEEANKEIKDRFMAIIGCNEQSSKKEIRKAIKMHQHELFAISEEIIPNLLISGWQDNPFFKEYAEIKNLEIGDTNDFYIEDNSVLSVGKLSGNHLDIKRQRLGAGTHQSVSTSWYGLGIYSEYERLLTGVEDWATFVTKIVDAFNRYVNELMYNALLQAGASLGAQWHKSAALTAGSSDATLRNLCMDVAMATGSEVVIMGTRTALQSVYALNNVNWASSDMKNEKYTTGKFGYWEGIRLVEIPQGFKLNDTTNYLVDNTKLFIMPAKDNRFLKLVYEGDANITSVVDKDVNQDMTYEYYYQQKLGLAVLTNLKWGMWSIIA